VVANQGQRLFCKFDTPFERVQLLRPLFANFSIDVVQEVFAAHGIHVLETYPDGQIMWGDQPIADRYTGRFCVADVYIPKRYDMFTVRAILDRLGKNADRPAIEASLEARIHEGDGGTDDEAVDGTASRPKPVA
jgi:hypothetical protein